MSREPTYEELEQRVRDLEEEAAENKLTEKELQESKNFLSNIFSSIQDGISILDREYNIIRVNHAMEEWYSHVMPLTGKKCYEVYHERDKPCKVCPVRKTLATGQAAHEVVPKRGAGREIVGWLDLFSFPLFDEATGQIIGVIEYVRDITERKQAEEALRESEERFRNIYRTAPLAFVLWDNDCKITAWNIEAEKIFGWSAKEVLGRNFFDFLIPENARPQVKDVVKDLLKGKIQNYSVNENLTKTGEVILCEWSNSILYDNEGHVRGAISLALDITERKRTEEALRASEERFRLTLDATSDGVWDYSLVTGETFYGKNWAKILGYTAEDLKNPSLSWKSLLHPDDKAGALAAVKDNLSGRTEQYKAEFRLRNKAGEWQWILSRGKVVDWDENDQPIRFVGTHKDISDRKRAEEALKESEEKHRTLFENANDAIFIVDPVKLTFIDANENAINRLGYSREELLRLTINDIAGSRSVRRNEAKVRELMQKGGIIFEHTLRHKDGRGIPVEISSKVIDYGDRKVIQAFVRDITERKQAQEELRKSSEKMQLFAYSVAHDLKNPSIAIYGLTKRLQEKHGDSLTEKGKIYCDQIQKSAEQIAALVETINQYIATKEKPLQLEDINPQEVFQIIKEEFAARLNIRQISLLVPSNVPEIKADKLSIFRVFRNFVDNALKYGGETLSKIEISYQDTDDSHIFAVSDDGIGLNKEDSRGIFGLFKRKETSSGIEGTGLGLAIVKEIAEHHQGEVWSKSGFRKGITFYISISKHL